ncbi:MAG: methyltransferase domain-containing protein [bacterium]|nr:methyltransferase domain-containing protein [bacterium]
MKISKEEAAKRLENPAFPRSAAYDAEWVLENEMGPSALWLTEWLCEEVVLKPGMRVLDMGCGRAMSSVFLAREFGVQVWANDLWIPAAENWKRVCDAGVADRVVPIHAEAHALPYVEGFFDAIVSVDSYHYYGTDDLYLKYFLSFVKPGGHIGIVVPGLMREFGDEVPGHLTRETPGGGRFWDPGECFSFHTVDWWRRHWEQTALVDMAAADTLHDGWKHWLQFEETKLAAGTNRWDDEVPALKADQGEYLGFVRLVASRKEAAS